MITKDMKNVLYHLGCGHWHSEGHGTGEIFFGDVIHVHTNVCRNTELTLARGVDFELQVITEGRK